MKKKSTLIITVISISIILILVLLKSFADIQNKKKNGFVRRFVSEVIPLNKKLSNTPLLKVCGVTNTNIFFSVPNPQWLIMMPRDLTKEDTLATMIPLSNKLLGINSLLIDSPRITFFANNVPGVFSGFLNKDKLTFVKLNSPIFTRAVQMSPYSAVIRTFDTSYQKQVFSKINIQTGEIIKQSEITEEKKDGGFSNDGLLRYDSTNKLLFYIQNYQNRFYCIDTNLNIEYIGRTIDTTNTNNILIKPIKIDGVNKLMPAKSRIKINEECCIGNNYLFIISKLIADNENKEEFENNSVVDTYLLKDGSYGGSFYIPKVKLKDIKSISISGNFLVILAEGEISTYQFK